MSTFDQNQRPKSEHSRVNLTNVVNGSGKTGWLMPIDFTPCIPGDVHRISHDIHLKLMPMISPPFGRLDVTCHSFFVPYRLLWPNWQPFIQNLHGELPPPLLPTIDIGAMDGLGDAARRMYNYFGIPFQPAIPVYTPVLAFNFAAYNRIMADYYLDSRLNNLEDFAGTTLVDGPNPEEPYFLRNRAWGKDYFTTASAEPQFGPDITIPFVGSDVYVAVNDATSPYTVPAAPTTFDVLGSVSENPDITTNHLYADTSALENSATINDLTLARAFQKMMYRIGRAGTRYDEWSMEMFGFKPSDSRLQRSEYITGCSQPVLITEVLNTAGVTGTATSNVQGAMAGHGVTPNASSKTRAYRCEEYGVIITIMSVIPRASYWQGIPRDYLRVLPTDFFQPALSHIGPQPIQNQELYAYGGNPTGTFGYTDIYDEYRFKLDRTVGDFARPTAGLDSWTIKRTFVDEPPLNANFVEVYAEDVLNIFAVQTDQDNLLFEVVNRNLASRKIPMFGTPMI